MGSYFSFSAKQVNFLEECEIVEEEYPDEEIYKTRKLLDDFDKGENGPGRIERFLEIIALHRKNYDALSPEQLAKYEEIMNKRKRE